MDKKKTLSESLKSRVTASSAHLVVRMKATDPAINLNEGDVLLVTPYWMDPTAKLSVIKRISDGFDPRCNIYRNQVELVK